MLSKIWVILGLEWLVINNLFPSGLNLIPDGFETPFVEESFVSIGLNFKNKYLIAENDVTMVIGEVQHIVIKNRDYINENGEVDIEKSNSVGVAGINSYYKCANFMKNEYIRSGDTVMLENMISAEKII